MRDHLKKFQFKPEFFYFVKNKKTGEVNWGLNGDGVIELIHQAGVTSVRVDETAVPFGKDNLSINVVVKIRLPDGGWWEACASVERGEFTANEDRWTDRRKYFMSQMAFSRARAAALEMALNISQSDLNELASEFGLSVDKVTRAEETVEPEPEEPEPPEEPPEVAEEKKRAMLNLLRAGAH